MTIKHCSLPTFGVLLALCFAGNSHAQRSTRLSPPNISFRAISIADSSHSMAVGDSASIVITKGGEIEGNAEWRPQVWSHLPSPCDPSHTFTGVSYYDTLDAAIIADNGLIFTTSDAGMQWTQYGVGITNQTLRAIMHTARRTMIVVGDSGIILRSRDSGKTWSRVNSGTTYNIHAISMNAGGIGYFVGEHGLIGKTTDFGATWPSVTDTITNAYSGRPINFRGVAVNTGGSSGLAVGDSGGFAQNISGASWQAVKCTVNDSSQNAAIASASYPSVAYIGYYGSNVGNYYFICSDHNFWIETDVPVQNGVVADSLFLLGDADGGTDDGISQGQCVGVWSGTSKGSLEPYWVVEWCSPYEVIWSFVAGRLNISPSVVKPDLPITVANFLYVSIDSLGKGFATETGGNFLKTTDFGFTWSVIGEDYNIFKGTDVYTIDSDHAIAAGWAGYVYRTNDGLHWDTTLIDPNHERLHSIAHPAPNVFVICGDFGTMFRSADDASTWNPSNTPTTEYLEAVAFSSPEIGVSVGSNGTILRTTDQGVTWTNINNPLTATKYSYRQLQAFPSGTYYATTDSAGLWRSTDQGQNWSQVNHVPYTMGMKFYNEKIGVVAENGVAPFDVGNIYDTARFAFTTDGFASEPVEFNIPIVNNNRMVFHFLDSNSFLCFGSDAFVVKVDMSSGGASVTELSSPQASLLRAFPNPSATHSTTIEYDIEHSGITTIELWNSLGEKVQTLFAGNEAAGHRARLLRINPELHGSFFVKVISGMETKTLPICVE